MTAGLSEVDSAATDAHKWLNTPYDTGLAFIRNESSVRAAMSIAAAYLPAAEGEREPFDFVPEMSRRARGLPVYAALRSLGRRGVSDLVERSCALATLFAELLAADPDARILNDVVLNQVLVRFRDSDDVTRDVVRRIQADGTLWAGGTVWHGLGAMRLSVSGWSTSESDVRASVKAILSALHESMGR
jgi:glutamate/tyrosine decarboxylase-like PLP-dependent enzyme